MNNTNVPPDVPPSARRAWLGAQAESEAALCDQVRLHETLAGSTSELDEFRALELSDRRDDAEQFMRVIENLS